MVQTASIILLLRLWIHLLPKPQGSLSITLTWTLPTSVSLLCSSPAIVGTTAARWAAAWATRWTTSVQTIWTHPPTLWTAHHAKAKEHRYRQKNKNWVHSLNTLGFNAIAAWVFRCQLVRSPLWSNLILTWPEDDLMTCPSMPPSILYFSDYY